MLTADDALTLVRAKTVVLIRPLMKCGDAMSSVLSVGNSVDSERNTKRRITFASSTDLTVSTGPTGSQRTTSQLTTVRSVSSQTIDLDADSAGDETCAQQKTVRSGTTSKSTKSISRTGTSILHLTKQKEVNFGLS